MPMCPPNHSPLYHSTNPSPPYLPTFVSYPRVYLLVYFHVQPLSNPPGYLFTYSPISLPINHLLSCLKTYSKIYQKDLCKQQPLFGAKIYADICARISSVSRCEQFSESGSGGKLRASKNRWCPRTNVSSYFLNKIEAIVFIILQRFCSAGEKIFTNNLPYAAWVVFFWVISGTTNGQKQ